MAKFWNGMCGQNGRIRDTDVVCIRTYGLWVWLLSQDHAPGTNMDSRLGSSSEKTTGRDLDSVESGSSLKSARDEGKSVSCLCQVLRTIVTWHIASERPYRCGPNRYHQLPQ